MKSTENELFLNCTTGAPAWSDPSAPIKPMNTVTVAGPAGATVEVALSSGGVFNETGSAIWTGNLNQKGEALLHVFCLSSGLITADAYIQDDPLTTATGEMVFNNYNPGKGALTGYAVVTGAAANGEVSNSIYLQVDMSFGATTARFQVISGNARLVGGVMPSLLEVPLYEDGTAMADLVDLVPETVELTLSLPEDSGSALDTKTTFVAFPA